MERSGSRLLPPAPKTGVATQTQHLTSSPTPVVQQPLPSSLLLSVAQVLYPQLKPEKTCTAEPGPTGLPQSLPAKSRGFSVTMYKSCIKPFVTSGSMSSSNQLGSNRLFWCSAVPHTPQPPSQVPWPWRMRQGSILPNNPLVLSLLHFHLQDFSQVPPSR